MNSPLISVNIPVFNRNKMLKECLKSFQEQTFKDFEVIIIDDGSDFPVCKDLLFESDPFYTMDKRLKFFTREHRGISVSFNDALNNSSGKYILQFGSDDLVMPTMLEDLYTIAENYPKYGAYYCNYFIKKPDGNLQRKCCLKTHSNKDAYEMMLKQDYIPHGSTLWRKECLPKCDETLESAVDWELMLQALENGVTFKHLKKKLWIHRTGHPREFGSQRQIDCCEKVLARRGYKFDKKTRLGIKI